MSKSHPDGAAAEPVFNPLSPDFIRDPYPTYHRLLRDDPMHRSQLGFTMASRHADVAFILRDARFGKDVAGRIRRTSGEKALEEPVYQSMLRWMTSRNPPDHTRLRGSKPSAAAPSRICVRASRRSWIERLTVSSRRAALT